MTIRVFISSTFRDMHAERDYLSRLVFPELRSRCQKRGAEFIGLDLRWGVTEEEAQREGALKICLDEIERCRPFFVCLLGSRYGWVPPLEEVPPKDFEDAARGTPPITLDEWYALDETNVPPVYRLRRDRPIPNDVADTLARFWEKAGLPTAGESITAREILRGVFEEGFPATHVMFYLRKPGIEAAPAFPPAFVPVFVEPDANRQTKLHDLETKIRKCKDPMVVRDYGAAFAGLRIEPNLLPDALSDEDRAGIQNGAVAADRLDRFSASVRQVILDRGTVELSGLETLGDQILEDLWTAIERELERPGEVLDEHQRERAYHERFVVDRTRLFLGREEIVQRVVDGLADHAGGNLMVVSGEPGSGKSALLAECARQARERLQSALVIPHFIGASPGSAILANTLRSVCETLKRECTLTEEVPDDPQKLLQKWPELLEEAGAKRRVILFLDALNQLDPLDHSHKLGWLPSPIPPGVTLVVSALPGDCLDRLLDRVSGGGVIDVPVLAARDRRAVVETHLGQRRKKLSPPQLERLLDTTKRLEAGRPLYLLVALEELSLFGSYDALDGRIDRLPPTVAELFDQVLERLEHDHGRDATESICRWIAVSRSGMLESEILDLLTGREQVFPRARWSRFYHALESHLRPVEEETGEGLLDFYHDQLRFAVYRRYLGMDSPEEQPTDAFREAHAELAQYFRKVAIEEGGEFPKWRWGQKRSLSELPHHQLSAGMWNALEKTLTDIGFIEAKSRTGVHYDLVRDYAEAEQAWPGKEEERRRDDEWQRRLEEYVTKLTDYARWYDRWRRVSRPRQLARALISRFLAAFQRRRLAPVRGAPPLPTPPASAAQTSEPEIADGGREWTPIERIQAWGRLVWNHTAALASGQEPAFQVAYNDAGSGPVADALEDRLRQGSGPSGSWLSLSNRPPFLLRPACLKTIKGDIEGHNDNRMLDDHAPQDSDYTLRVWDLEAGRSSVIKWPTDKVDVLAATPDGRRVVSGRTKWGDGTICFLDLDTGQSRLLKDYQVQDVAVTPDGRRAVFACGWNLLVWDLDTGHSRLLKGRKAWEAEFRALAITPDGRRAVSGSGDTQYRSDGDYRTSLRVWDLETGHSRLLKGQTGRVEAVAVTPDGRRAIAGSTDASLRVWDLETGRSRLLEGHTDEIFAVAVTPDGRHAISGSGDRTLRVWDLETGDSRILERYLGRIGAVTVTPDGRRAVSIRSSPGPEICRTVAVTPDGRRAVSGTYLDYTLCIWDLEMGQSRVLQEHTDDVRAVAVTPDGRRAVSEHTDGTLRVWNPKTGDSSALEGHTGEVCTVLAVAPDGGRAVSGNLDGKLRVWNLKTGGSNVFEGHTDQIGVVAITPDGQFAVSGCIDRLEDSRDTNLGVWDLDTGQSRVLEGHTETILAIAVTPDGRHALSGSRDTSLRIWDLKTSDSRVLEGHEVRVQAVAVTPDGRQAISVCPRSGSDTLRVWDLQTGHSRVLEKHQYSASVIAVTPDGRRAVVGYRSPSTYDGELRVWDLETGRSRLLGGDTAINAVAVTPDGRRVVAGGGHDGRLGVWDLESGESVATYGFAGFVRYVAQQFPQLVVRTASGRLEFLRVVGARHAAPLPLLGPRITTAVRLWLSRPESGGGWDGACTAFCDGCGQRFPAPATILGTIAAITRTAHLGLNDSPCLKLPAEVWDEPSLLGQCPLCREPLKFNPFVVDNREGQ